MKELKVFAKEISVMTRDFRAGWGVKERMGQQVGEEMAGHWSAGLDEVKGVFPELAEKEEG